MDSFRRYKLFLIFFFCLNSGAEFDSHRKSNNKQNFTFEEDNFSLCALFSQYSLLVTLIWDRKVSLKEKMIDLPKGARYSTPQIILCIDNKKHYVQTSVSF